MGNDKLPSVEIIPRDECLSRSTMDSIQSGLYFGTIGQFKEIRDRISKEVFAGKLPRVIGTGGFASLFVKENLFDEENSDLVLRGLHLALKMNT